jgi:hypothetical protein
MEPLSTNGFDPALLRVVEKRGHERELTPRRKRTAATERRASDENVGAETVSDNNDDRQAADGTGNAESPKHALDDLA